MNSTTPLVDAAVDDTALEDKNQPHTDWITAYAGREIEAKMNEARRELAHARDMLTVANETSAAADRIRIGLERELNESHAREAQLRAALKDATDNCLWRSDSPTPLSEEESARIYWKAMNALELPAPPVVPFEDVKPLVEALTWAIREAKGRLPDWFHSALSTFTAKHKL